MFGTIIEFGDGIIVSSETLEKTSKVVIEAIKKELPKEAQVYVVVKGILERSIELVREKPIIL